jgi:hypothetical protein
MVMGGLCIKKPIKNILNGVARNTCRVSWLRGWVEIRDQNLTQGFYIDGETNQIILTGQW